MTPPERWAATLAFRKLEGKPHTFTGPIDSDGTSVCVHFVRKKMAGVVPIVTATPGATNPLLVSPDQTEQPPEDDLPQTKPPPGDDRPLTEHPPGGRSNQTKKPLAMSLDQYCIIGNDPGRKNIYLMAMVGPKDQVVSWKLSRKQYYVEAGTKPAQKQSESWQRNLKEPLQRLSEVSSKDTALAAHHRFLEMWLATYDPLYDLPGRVPEAAIRLPAIPGKRPSSPWSAKSSDTEPECSLSPWG